MSWKSFLVIILIFGVGGWYVLFGPGTCEILSETRTGQINEDLTLWVRDNISSDWLDGHPQATEIVVKKLKIKKMTPTDKRFVDDVNVLIIGNFTLSGQSKAVPFKKNTVIRVNRYLQPNQYSILE